MACAETDTDLLTSQHDLTVEIPNAPIEPQVSGVTIAAFVVVETHVGGNRQRLVSTLHGRETGPCIVLAAKPAARYHGEGGEGRALCSSPAQRRFSGALDVNEADAYRFLRDLKTAHKWGTLIG